MHESISYRSARSSGQNRIRNVLSTDAGCQITDARPNGAALFRTRIEGGGDRRNRARKPIDGAALLEAVQRTGNRWLTRATASRSSAQSQPHVLGQVTGSGADTSPQSWLTVFKLDIGFP